MSQPALPIRLLQPFLARVRHLFGVDVPQLLSAAERREQIMTSIAIGLPVTALFAVFNAIEGFTYLAVAEAVGVTLLPVAVLLQRHDERGINLAEWLVIAWGATVTTALAVFGGVEGTGVLWIFSFPFLAFFLKGQMTAWVVSLAWVVTVIGTRLSSASIPGAWTFSKTYDLHLAAAMVCAVTIAAVFALVRVRFMLLLVSARERSDAASLAKSRFLTATSHDLRQPLMAVGLFLDALGRTPLNGEQRRLATHLDKTVQSMSDMLNTLLGIARLDAGAIEARPQPVSCNTLFAWLENEFASTFQARQLRFKLFFPAEECKLLTDPDLIRNILRNLLGNATKYTQQGGVLVAVRRRPDHALLQVWDTGIGIPAEAQPHIFDEYYQVGNAARDSTRGVGLGLAMVQRQARLLGSEVICRSRPGKGSLFEIRLPLAED